ncbi:hypothetical protein [Actinomycetospora chibensis]|uniref:Integral membrane protein n=1 Tax=Actinomycetospora chibensis TaxID=663606 RepID=A0ABV9REE3_9PSEU|nr:hypothetical protein [Actinomycetospora chibensis]MDD7925046.1 hypothetical protein [Actinomycetospora chibensis]
MTGVITVLVVGTVVSLLVGRVLRRAGRPFLDDVLRDERVADAGATLLTVLFHLLSLGTVALVASTTLPPMPWIYDVSLKLGIVLIVIGVAHGATLMLLLRIKKRRRRQILEENLAAGRPMTDAD